MVDRILIPTDGSEHSYDAARTAIELAEPLGAEIHVVSVVRMIPTRDRLRYDPGDEANEAIEEIRELIEPTNLPFVDNVLEGFPPQEIVEYARANDIDLIVMGTHGRTGLDRVLIGSVAERMVRTSPIPVLTVPPGERG